MLRVTQNDLCDAQLSRLANRLAKERVRPVCSFRWLQVIRRLEISFVDFVRIDKIQNIDGLRLFDCLQREAEAAVQLEPESGDNLRTLGMAQYRTGRYGDALETLTKSEKLNATKDGSLPSDLAFLAMAHQHLGHKEQAQAALARLRAELKQPDWEKNAEAQGFLREAAELIEGKAGSKEE